MADNIAFVNHFRNLIPAACFPKDSTVDHVN